MDEVTKNLISKKFNVPSEIMYIIDEYLLKIYKDDHRQKFQINDLKIILEKVNNTTLRNPSILNNMDNYIQFINTSVYDTDFEDNSDFDDNDYYQIGYITKETEKYQLVKRKWLDRAKRNPNRRTDY